jgi:hypothetical protein
MDMQVKTQEVVQQAKSRSWDWGTVGKIVVTLGQCPPGPDYVEAALTIAKIAVCEKKENEETAEELLKSIGRVLKMLDYWDKTSPERDARVRAIKQLAFWTDGVPLEELPF